MTPDDALRHIWILEGLPQNVLYHHCKMYDIPDDSVSYFPSSLFRSQIIFSKIALGERLKSGIKGIQLSTFQ